MRRPRSHALLRALALVALVGLGLPLAASVWVGTAGRATLHETVADVPARPVAIVLGARVYASGVPSPILEDRLRTALDLYRAGKVERILVSGDHAAPEYDEPNAMRRWLVTRGVPDADVFIDHAGLRTLDTMDRAARIYGVRGAVVCTQRFHLPRALFLARQASIDAVGVVADRRAYLHHERDVAREWVARAVAFADSYVLGTRARHGGLPLPITGDARATHDAATEATPR